MIHQATGNLLLCQADALVNTVNTEGVMGKGIALQFKRAYPDMYATYARACKLGQVRLGQMWVWPTGRLDGPKAIINFPTKGHWKSNSRLADIDAGLDDLVRIIMETGIHSIAVPPLGCGNGGLDWNIVRPRIEAALQIVPGLEVHLYRPEGSPPAAAMPVASRRPNMSRGKAALIVLLARYVERALEVTILETQKLMYFLQLAGEQLRLDYQKDRYGPYANNLGHVLKNIEGHFITGFGDGSATVSRSEPLTILPDGLHEALKVVEGLPDLASRISRVLNLADGFESAYDMELLATVHWVSTNDQLPATSAAAAGELVRAWSPRKQGLFGQTHIEQAWERLRDQGWLPSLCTMNA